MASAQMSPALSIARHLMEQNGAWQALWYSISHLGQIYSI